MERTGRGKMAGELRNDAMTGNSATEDYNCEEQMEENIKY